MEEWEDGKARNHPHPNIGLRVALIKEVYRLHAEEFLSYREIADECDISIATVSKYIKEAAGDDLPLDAAAEKARLFNMYNKLIKEIRTSLLSGQKDADGWRDDMKLMLAAMKEYRTLLGLDKVEVKIEAEVTVDPALEELVMQFEEDQDIRNKARARRAGRGGGDGFRDTPRTRTTSRG